MKNSISIFLSVFVLLILMAASTFLISISKFQTVTTFNEFSQNDTVTLPVIMYHQMSTNAKSLGNYVVSVDEFEKDLQYISSQGYTSISTAELMDFYKNGTALPEKPILITFDDGYETTFEYAYPLLQKYNMKAVISIIGKYTDLYSTDIIKDLSYSHATWDQIRQMQASGVFEIGNHTYDLHLCEKNSRKGCSKLDGESIEDYTRVLEENVLGLNNEILSETGVLPNVFTFPFGFMSNESFDILESFGFDIALTCSEKLNYIKSSDYVENSLIFLNRFNRPHSKTVAEILG